MATYFPTSPITRSRTFSPVILFHDHQYVKDANGALEHIHIPYGDPHYGRYIETHKKRIHRMLEHNEKFWTDVREYTEQGSPIASMASSPTPPLYSTHDELTSPPKRYRPYYLPQKQQRQRRTSTATQYTTAGSVMDDNISVSSSSSSSPASPHSSSMMDPLSHPTTPTTPGPITPTHHHHHHHHPLTVRKQPPSSNNSSSNNNNNNNNSNLVKRRRGNLPKAVTAILREWLSRHKKHPYPTEDEKAQLARQTNLTLNQISNWFINARRRILQPMLQKERQARMMGEEEDHASNTLDIFPYNEPSSRRGRKRSNASSMDVDLTKPGAKYNTSYDNMKRRTSHHHHQHHPYIPSPSTLRKR